MREQTTEPEQWRQKEKNGRLVCTKAVCPIEIQEVISTEFFKIQGLLAL